MNKVLDTLTQLCEQAFGNNKFLVDNIDNVEQIEIYKCTGNLFYSLAIDFSFAGTPIRVKQGFDLDKNLISEDDLTFIAYELGKKITAFWKRGCTIEYPLKDIQIENSLRYLAGVECIAEETFNRKNKLEELKEEVEDFLNKALFIVGADKIKKILEELNKKV